MHGLSNHPLNHTWITMKQRCYNPKHPHYKNYGGRGVKVCKEWADSFMAFYNWAIANGWEHGLELDKDKNSPNMYGTEYSPEFCCFITHKENMLFRGNSKRLLYNGKEKILSEWCRELKIDRRTMHRRIFTYNWTVQQAFETPIGSFYGRIFINKKAS